MKMNPLPDVQSREDDRNIYINEVGVKDFHLPILVPMRDGTPQHTVAVLSAAVDLCRSRRGTHMSRFLKILHGRKGKLAPIGARSILKDLVRELGSNQGFLSMTFPLFIYRKAPVSGEEGPIHMECRFRSRFDRGPIDLYETLIGITIRGTSLCPCSKEMSRMGAHNQRSVVSIDLYGSGDEIVWLEELVEIADQSVSCILYPILKRGDEAYVTDLAYDNPKFVEDIVRDASMKLDDLLQKGKADWYRVLVDNEESIHDHNAFARIERGKRGPLTYCV
jgi:GTP cyclohydrolase I